MPVSEDDFRTELEDGILVPVREVGSQYVVAWDCLDKEVFLGYLSLLLGEDEAEQYDEEDIVWTTAETIRFEQAPSIDFGEYESFTATHITLVKRW